MTLKRDLSRGLRDPLFLTIFVESEGGDPIAIFPEPKSTPIPNEGDVVELESFKQLGDGEGEGETIGRFTVNKIEYEYSLAEPPDEMIEEDDAPDTLYVTTEVVVTPVEP